MGSRDNALEPSEKHKFRMACKSEMEVLVYHVLCEFGLRVSEFVHMQKSWLLPDTGMIKIPASRLCDCTECKKKHGYKGYWQPKTKAGARLFPARAVSEEGWIALTTYFTTHDSIDYTRVGIYNMVKSIGERAELPHPVTPHALRATAAMSLSSRPGVTGSVLQQIFGWENIQTSNHYIKMGGIDIMRAFDIKLPEKVEEELPPPPDDTTSNGTKKLVRVLKNPGVSS